jgi:hypothetical protein
MAMPHSHDKCAALVKRRKQMNANEKLDAMAEVAQAWVTLDVLNATIMRIGDAAHKAGATTEQHQLEVIYHNLARIIRELADVIGQIHNIKGE